MAESCPLFDKLPRELRDEIYKLVFTEDEGEEERDLHKATPPSKGLATACKQGYTETNELYKAAYRQFWSTNDFVINGEETARGPLFPNVYVDPLPWQSRDLDRITSLTISSDRNAFEAGGYATLTQEDRRGEWYCRTGDDGGFDRSYWLRVMKKSDGGVVYVSMLTYTAEEPIEREKVYPSLTEQLYALVVFQGNDVLLRRKTQGKQAIEWAKQRTKPKHHAGNDAQNQGTANCPWLDTAKERPPYMTIIPVSDRAALCVCHISLNRHKGFFNVSTRNSHHDSCRVQRVSVRERTFDVSRLWIRFQGKDVWLRERELQSENKRFTFWRDYLVGSD
ncbi:hypothetical protein PRZ48_012191 [Zasmidium cellare]|uniref:Uncharacterized protein n=1 Tax=Zasmidium cellare TaxID=395010 RepID=A0ABR0E4R5_ZASCE|nr:hypothetical protein PRZ48_012191 [Zasmidium cellare]